MKRWIVCLLLVPGALAPLWSQEQQPPIHEKVQVVNVEVPVRVYQDGRPVMDLKREEFTVYEDGREQVINGFFPIRKRIAGPTGSATAPVEEGAPARYFVLVFRVYDFNEPLRQGVSHTFDRILRPQDALLVFVNNQTRVYERLAEKERIHAEIEDLLRRECHEAKNTMRSYLTHCEKESALLCQRLATPGMATSTPPSMLTFYLKQYMDLLKEYKQRFLAQDIDMYYNFAHFLAGIEREKWVINFHQLEMFPNMGLGKIVRRVIQTFIEQFRVSDIPENLAASLTLTKTMQEIDNELSYGTRFPTEEISKLFYKVNATFHTLFIPLPFDAAGKDMEMKQIATDIENNLRELTRKTGGQLLSSTDLVSSLTAVADSEDSYYLLTYVPTDPKKVGKIKVKISRKKCSVMYDDNLRADYIADYLNRRDRESPELRFREVKFSDKRLQLVVTGFKMQKNGDKTLGRVALRVQVKSPLGDTLFDQGRTVDVAQDPLSLYLDFGFLSFGRHDIIVDARDLLTGRTCSEVVQPMIE